MGLLTARIEFFPEEKIVVSLIQQLNIAEYLTTLPPRELFRGKQHRAIALARENLGAMGALHPSAAVKSGRKKKSRSGKWRFKERGSAKNVVKLLEGE